MRILFHTTDFPPNLGGVAAVSLEQAVHLAKLGNEVRVETTDFGELPRVCVETPGLSVHAHRIAAKPIARVLPLSEIAFQAAREFSPDLFYASTHRGFGLPMALCAKRHRKPYALYVHGTEILSELNSVPRRAILTWLLRHAAYLITNSHNTATSVLRKNFPNGLPPIAVNHPGIDQKRLAEPGSIQRGHELRRMWMERMGLAPETVVLLSLCRVNRQKGIDLVLHALSGIARKGDAPSFLYVVAGDGPDRAELEMLASELGIASRVFFSGLVPYSDTAAYLHASDVYVQPSQRVGVFLESFGISFVEAGFCGLACIGSRFGGIPEAVRDGETGILVEPGDEHGLREAIELLITDGEKRAQMGQAGKSFAASFSWEEHAKRLNDIFLECCAQRGALR
jgi:phosphatidylinositol alpha-1,6-mannosyltransferase